MLYAVEHQVPPLGTYVCTHVCKFRGEEKKNNNFVLGVEKTWTEDGHFERYGLPAEDFL